MKAVRKLDNIRLVLELFKKLFQFSPIHLSLVFILMLVRSFTSGAGLLLILPLFQVIGISMGGATSTVFTKSIVALLHTLHLPLTLITILLCYSMVVILAEGLGYIEDTLRSRLQEQHMHHMRTTIHHEILHAKWSFLLQKNMADLLHGITVQAQSVSQSYIQILNLLNKVLLAGVYVVLAFLLSWQMTLIAIACALLLLSLLLPLHRLTSQTGQSLLRRNQDMFQSFFEQLSALKMIKSSNFESKFIAKSRVYNTSLENQTQRLFKASAVSKLLYSCGSVIFFSVLLYVAISILAVPTGALLMLLFVFSRLLPNVSAIQQSYQFILRVLPSYRDLKKIREECLAHQEMDSGCDLPQLSLKHAIHVRDLSFSYNPGVAPMVVHRMSFCIKKNTTTALIGPSGAGKTTLSDLIVGLLEPTAGAIYIDEQLLRDSNREAWRKSLAYVTQSVFLFNTTIRENLYLFSEHATDVALWSALEKASVAEFVAKLEKGLDTEIGDRGVRLSGGESQRIALARALLMNPQLLILDESTNSLDKHNIHNIQQTLSRLHGETTILIISHQAEMSAFADQVITVGLPVISEGALCVN